MTAAVYYDDMYVDAGPVHAHRAGGGQRRTWVTNEWQHDGVRVSGGGVLARLMDIAKGVHGS